MKVIASSVRKGNVLEVDGQLYAVISAESFFPGKGTPTTQIDMRRLSDGVKTSQRYKTTEQVERAYVDQALLTELEELVAELAPAGRVKAAGLALLRLTSPGIPDTYQGTETEQLVLVDPDNRGRVPFAGDGSLKFTVTRTTLRLRREHPELFAGYRPLEAPDHLVAFTRAEDRLAVVVTCLMPASPGTSASGSAPRWERRAERWRPGREWTAMAICAS